MDIGVDYGEFKGRLHVYESGSKQNFKISTLTNHLANMLLQCSQASTGSTTKQLNQSYMFKLCLKKLFKKVCKLQGLKRTSDTQTEVLFLPELLSDVSVARLYKMLELFDDGSAEPLHILTLVTCPKVLSNLTHAKNPVFKRAVIFTLAFSD